LVYRNERNRIGRISSSGEFIEYSLPVSESYHALWFTQNQGNQIGRITIGGEVTTYNSPTKQAGTVGITNGPDDALWFVETEIKLAELLLLE